MESGSGVATEQPRMRPVDDREHLERRRGGGDYLFIVAMFALGAAATGVLHAMFPDDKGLLSWTSLGIAVLGAGVALIAHRIRRRRSA